MAIVPSNQGQPRGTVLVVDADAESRAATTAHLAARYEVLGASDAASAHALAVASQPDAALMEVSLPGVEGPTALQHWRADERTTGIPVLVIGHAGTDEKTQVACLAGGADFLQRPINGPILLARVDRAIRDARERRRLAAAAQTDGLTGLANFRALESRLREELDRARRYNYPLAMAMIDLDYLKDVNDRFGHAAGNQVLAAFARRLTRSLRGTDFAARYGGDEFAVLLTHQTWREAAVFCERLRTSLITRPLGAPRRDSGDRRQPATSPGTTPPKGTELAAAPTTISVGVAAHAPASPRASGEELLRAADAALYEAKRLGRNQVVIFERDLQATAEGGASRGH